MNIKKIILFGLICIPTQFFAMEKNAIAKPKLIQGLASITNLPDAALDKVINFVIAQCKNPKELFLELVKLARISKRFYKIILKDSISEHLAIKNAIIKNLLSFDSNLKNLCNQNSITLPNEFFLPTSNQTSILEYIKSVISDYAQSLSNCDIIYADQEGKFGLAQLPFILNYLVEISNFAVVLEFFGIPKLDVSSKILTHSADQDFSQPTIMPITQDMENESLSNHYNVYPDANQQNGDINKLDILGYTPLMNAVLAQNITKFKELLANEAIDVNIRSKLKGKNLLGNKSALFIAITKIKRLNKNSHYYKIMRDIIQLLLEHPRIKLKPKNPKTGAPSQSALQIAHNNGLEEIENMIKECMSKNPSAAEEATSSDEEGNLLNTYDEEGYTPLIRAALDGNVKKIGELLNHKKIKINLKRSKTKNRHDKKSALVLAIRKIKRFKEDTDGASYKNLRDVIQLLLNHPDVNLSKIDTITGVPNKSALEIAQELELPEIENMIKLRMEKKVSEMEISSNQPQAMTNNQNSNSDVMMSQISDEALPNIQDRPSETQVNNFDFASDTNQQIVTAPLFSQKMISADDLFLKEINDPNFDVNAFDQFGHTPLMNAVLEIDVDEVEKLLSQENIDVNLITKSKNTTYRKCSALMLAVKKIINYGENSPKYQNLRKIIQLLLDLPNIILDTPVPARGPKAKTALEIAQAHDKKEIANMIQVRMEKNVPEIEIYSIQNQEMANRHLNQDGFAKIPEAMPTIQDKLGEGPVANLDFTPNIISQLTAESSTPDYDINKLDTFGYTPLMNAVLARNISKIKQLLANESIDVNIRSKLPSAKRRAGRSALFIAMNKIKKLDKNSNVYNTMCDIIQLLLDHPNIILDTPTPARGLKAKSALKTAKDYGLKDIEDMITLRENNRKAESLQSSEISSSQPQEMLSNQNSNQNESTQSSESVILDVNIANDKTQEKDWAVVALSQNVAAQSIESSSTQNFTNFLSNEELMKELEKTKSQVAALQSSNDRLQQELFQKNNEVAELKLNQTEILGKLKKSLDIINLFKIQLSEFDTTSVATLIDKKRANEQTQISSNDPALNQTDSEQNQESLTKKNRLEK